MQSHTSQQSLDKILKQSQPKPLACLCYWSISFCSGVRDQSHKSVMYTVKADSKYYI